MSEESKRDEGAEEERWAVFTELLLPAVTAARTLVGIDEATFRTHTFHRMPRQFFFWTALDEVLKTGMFLMKLDGFLGDEGLRRAGTDDAVDPTHRVIEALLLEEERLRARRLCELFVQLVLFNQKDEPQLYEHFLLLEDLVEGAAYNEELRKFHGKPSEWVRASTDRTVARLHALEPTVDVNDAWYEGRDQRPARPENWRNLLSSARQRLIRALPLMPDFERLALGTTYGEAFGGPSSTIHYRAGANQVDHSRETTVVAEGTKLGMVAFCVIRRIHLLLGGPDVRPLEQITRVLESNSEPSRLMEALNARSVVAVGDFVLARGYLGQVVEEHTTTFGYRSVRVELLAERPLDELSADWFRVRDVVRLFSKEKLVAGVRKEIGSTTAHVDDETLRKAALSAWAIGLRDQILSRGKKPAA